MPGIEHKISLNEEQLAKLNAAKEWAKNNWKPFVAGGAVVGITVFVLRGRSVGAPVSMIAPVFNNTPSIAPVFNNDNSSVVNFGGYATKIVKRLSDGKIWETVTESAEAANKPVSVMSRHLHNYPGYETIDNEVYRIIGLRTTG